jgi:hypothetical protein
MVSAAVRVDHSERGWVTVMIVSMLMPLCR